jgi:flagellar basal-body rod protein FlgC
MSGIDNLFSGMRIASNGMMAERTRIDVIAENIANARTTSTPEGGAYRRKLVVFEPMLREAMGGGRGGESSGVLTTRIERDYSSDFQLVSDPGHPDANADGMVQYPNVNTVLEMSDLITALRAYEANITAQENFVRMAERAIALAR